MNAGTYREETVFYAALKLTQPGERRRFLDQACAGDPALRDAVEELLSTQDDAERFFVKGGVALSRLASRGQGITPADVAAGARAAILPEEEQLGFRIGRYRLLQKIGEGGCGAVFLAEQEEPVRRQVALKVIKLGMDTKSVIARFEAERQALALMDHPNIARVLDAGATATGRPFFVMELVRGLKITEYCDQHNLDTRQRLDLFLQICRAIQHAHQKGIIHRDIKPSNILVTLHDAGVPGVPKVIDFGIAKATGTHLSDQTVLTTHGHFVGTPAYMSPEQAELSGLDVDTRSDIYSLGVLLYELLTGKTPFDQKELVESGLDGMRRTLREKEPHRPSTKLDTLPGTELTRTALHRQAEPPKLQSQLRGDLDWIVMKALEKDRTRRYETANGLALDIQRHLNNEPVVARPPGRLYRFQKLVRRNRIVFAAGTAVAVALVTGLSASTWLFFRERAALREQALLREQAELREKVSQAALLVSQERFAEADQLISAIPSPKSTLESAAVFRSLGEWYALRNQWKRSADYFNALLRVNELDGWDVATLDFLECGPALIESGETTGYESFRRAAISRFANTPHPVADRIVKICLLIPADQSLLNSLEPMAEAAAKSFAHAERESGGDAFRAAWMSVSLALLEYRQGNFARSAEWSRRCLKFPEHIAPRTATARVLLAMASQQLGEHEIARTELAQGRGAILNKFKSGLERGSGVHGFWFDWSFARILMREASVLIEGSNSPAGQIADGQ